MQLYAYNSRKRFIYRITMALFVAIFVLFTMGAVRIQERADSLSTFTVTTTIDSSAGALRQATMSRVAMSYDCAATNSSIPAPTPDITPRRTSPYGKWNRTDYALLAALIYFEAGPKASLESACAVGWVVRNRLEAVSRWGDSTFTEVIYHHGQFSVTKPRKPFKAMVAAILSKTNDRAKNAKRAARYVLQGRESYKLESEVQAFRSERRSKKWGGHKFYRSIGGNDFFYW